MKGLTKIKGISTDEIKEVLTKNNFKFQEAYYPFLHFRDPSREHDFHILDTIIITESCAEKTLVEMIDKFFGKEFKKFFPVEKLNHIKYQNYTVLYKIDSLDFVEIIPYHYGSFCLTPNREIIQQTIVVYNDGFLQRSKFLKRKKPYEKTVLFFEEAFKRYDKK